MTTMVSPRTFLKQLTGEWKGDGTMLAHGETYPIRVRWKNELVAASYGLCCEARITGVPGVEEFVEVELIGYDDYEQQFHMGTLCNFGEAHDLQGNWQDNRLQVKDDRESFEVYIISPEKLRIHVENAGGGPVFEVNLEK